MTEFWKSRLNFKLLFKVLLVNTFAAHEKFPVLNRDNLTTPIPMELFNQQKNFCEFFAAFLKSSLNFEHSGKKDNDLRFCVLEITDSKNLVK